jgi:hypothetical protein
MSVENKVFNAEVEMAVQQIRVEHMAQLINENNPQGDDEKVEITEAQVRSIVEALAWSGELQEFFDNLVRVRGSGYTLG